MGERHRLRGYCNHRRRLVPMHSWSLQETANATACLAQHKNCSIVWRNCDRDHKTDWDELVVFPIGNGREEGNTNKLH